MFSKTHTSSSPWITLNARSKMKVRLEAVHHALNTLSYKRKGESKVNIHPDPAIASQFHCRGKVVN